MFAIHPVNILISNHQHPDSHPHQHKKLVYHHRNHHYHHNNLYKQHFSYTNNPTTAMAAPTTLALAALAARQVVNDPTTEEKGQNFDKAIIGTVIVVVAGVAIGLGVFFTYTCVQKRRERKANEVSPV